MKIYREMKKARDTRNFDTLSEFFHDDCVFVRHQTGTSILWSDFKHDFRAMMESGKFDRLMDRCIYENDDILVEHSIMRFPDGTRESIIIVQMIENGKIVGMETGASKME